MIGIFAAMGQELRPLAAMLEGQTTGAMRLGRLAGRAVCLCVTGMGPDAARAATRQVLTRFPLEAALLVGTAGALAPELAPPELIIGRELCTAEQPDEIYAADPRLVALGAAVAGPCHVGRIATVRHPVADAAERQALAAATGALCAEMEGAAFAAAAARAGVPFLVLRAVSDRADCDLAADFARHGPAAIARACEPIPALLARL